MAGLFLDAGAVSVVLTVGAGGIVRTRPQPIAGPYGWVPGLAARSPAAPATAAIACLLELLTQPLGGGPRGVIGQVGHQPGTVQMHISDPIQPRQPGLQPGLLGSAPAIIEDDFEDR